MTDEVKTIIQLVVYPLVTALVSLALVVFNINVAFIRKAIKEQKEKEENDIREIKE